MVDFQNENTVSTPPSDLLKVLIIQRRNDVIDGIESYYKIRFNNSNIPDNIIRARMLSLYYELSASLDRWKTSKLDIKKIIIESDINKVLELFEEINKELDLKKIIRIDNRPDFDRTDTEQENDKMLK